MTGERMVKTWHAVTRVLVRRGRSPLKVVGLSGLRRKEVMRQRQWKPGLLARRCSVSRGGSATSCLAQSMYETATGRRRVNDWGVEALVADLAMTRVTMRPKLPNMTPQWAECVVGQSRQDEGQESDGHGSRPFQCCISSSSSTTTLPSDAWSEVRCVFPTPSSIPLCHVRMRPDRLTHPRTHTSATRLTRGTCPRNARRTSPC